jgi:hypothetical protein
MKRNPKAGGIRDGGIATLALFSGMVAVGFVSIGLEADLGVFIMLVFAAGTGAVGYSSLKIGEAITKS